MTVKAISEEVRINTATLWLWRDFWTWQFVDVNPSVRGELRRRRLFHKALALVMHDREVDGRQNDTCS